MADLIDRQALLKEICNSCDGWCDNTNCDCVNCKSEHRCDVVCEIADAPAIDAVVLPCKLGEKLYSVDGKIAEAEEFLVDKRGITMTVSFECDYNCEECAFNSWRQEYCGEYSCDGEWGKMAIPATQIEKSLFRTYEEAKAELWKRRAEG